MAMGLTRTLAGGATGLLHLAGIKEVLESVSGFLQQHKDNPLLRTIIESQFRELREEAVTEQLIRELEQGPQEKINRFFLFLRKGGLVQYIQDVQNITFTLVVFESVGIPLAKATEADKDSGTPLFILKEESFATLTAAEAAKFRAMKTIEAKSFLQLLAEKIGAGNSLTDFQAAMDYLKAHRLIGQKVAKTLLGQIIGKAEILMSPAGLGSLKTKAVKLGQEQFPTDQPGGVGEFTKWLREKREKKEKNK